MAQGRDAQIANQYKKTMTAQLKNELDIQNMRLDAMRTFSQDPSNVQAAMMIGIDPMKMFMARTLGGAMSGQGAAGGTTAQPNTMIPSDTTGAGAGSGGGSPTFTGDLTGLSSGPAAGVGSPPAQPTGASAGPQGGPAAIASLQGAGAGGAMGGTPSGIPGITQQQIIRDMLFKEGIGVTGEPTRTFQGYNPKTGNNEAYAITKGGGVVPLNIQAPLNVQWRESPTPGTSIAYGPQGQVIMNPAGGGPLTSQGPVKGGWGPTQFPNVEMFYNETGQPTGQLRQKPTEYQYESGQNAQGATVPMFIPKPGQAMPGAGGGSQAPGVPSLTLGGRPAPPVTGVQVDQGGAGGVSTIDELKQTKAGRDLLRGIGYNIPEPTGAGTAPAAAGGQTVIKPGAADLPISEKERPLWINRQTGESAAQYPNMTANQAAGKGFTQLTQADRDAFYQLRTIDPMLTEMGQLMPKVFGPMPSTPEAQNPDVAYQLAQRYLYGSARQAGAASQANPDAANFQSLARGGIIRVMRSLEGANGRIPIQEIQMGSSLIPSLNDTPVVAYDKFNRLMNWRQGIEQRLFVGSPGGAPAGAPATNKGPSLTLGKQPPPMAGVTSSGGKWTISPVQ
jgi:hypothetical protein